MENKYCNMEYVCNTAATSFACTSISNLREGFIQNSRFFHQFPGMSVAYPEPTSQDAKPRGEPWVKPRVWRLKMWAQFSYRKIIFNVQLNIYFMIT
jgi:hypothetical protein